MAEQLEELIVEREAAAEARDRKSRIRTTVALVVVAVIAVAGVVLSILGSAASTRAENRRTADVAAALAKPVADKVLADGRAESAQAARTVLRAANGRLIANRLPIVPEPPADALSVLVQLQANRAQLLADFGTVDFIAEGFRDRFGQAGAFPASFLDRIPVTEQPDPSAVADDGVVEVLPGDDGPTVIIEPPRDQATGVPPRAQRSPGTPQRTVGRPAPRSVVPAPVPAPAPAPNRDRGLCLLGLVLCER